MPIYKYLCFLVAILSPISVTAQGLAGPYLAANSANYDGSFLDAADYYARALQADPDNRFIEQNALISFVSAGEFDRAVGIANNIGAGVNLYTDLVLMAEYASRGDYDAALDSFPRNSRQVSALLSGLLDAWLLVGTDDLGNALGSFDGMDQNETVTLYGQYHKSLALAHTGNFAAAADIMGGGGNPVHLDIGSIKAHIQILSQLGKTAEALAILDNVGADDPLSSLREQLESGETLEFDQVENAAQGMALALITMADALSREEPSRLALFYARLAQKLHPENVDAMLTTGDILAKELQYGMANDVYAQVPEDSSHFKSATIGRSEMQRRDGDIEGATATLQALADAYPRDVNVLNALGDIHRVNEDFAQADAAYTQAIENLGPPNRAFWVLYYTRGIANERQGEWDEAEADFRHALELSPNEPVVLNYLGYSFIEMQTNMAEAQQMIEMASANAPDNGFITDSLAWVLYRLGKFEEAVPHMERAAQQLPVDPIVNDHLGDVLWMVGRKVEARFQWRRALSFEPEDVDEVRIRRKLDVGLDIVLEEESDI